MDQMLSGLIYVKQGRVGSRSEGPDYYLQTADGDYLLRYQERHPWEPDYQLEFHARRMVEISGTVDDRMIEVKSIRPILTSSLPRAAAPPAPQQLRLKAGERAALLASDLAIEFVQITEDSRCPVGAVCVWEGLVTASLRVSQATAPAHELSLTLPGAARTALGHSFTLLSVEPRRTAEAPDAPLPYVITVAVAST